MDSHVERHILYPSAQIASAVDRLAAEITRDYQTKTPVLIGILKGVFIFMADLIRRLDFPLEVEFVRLSSYGRERQTSGEVKVVQERLYQLEMEFEEEMAKLTESYAPEDLELTEVLIRPRKSDIFISPLSLVWSPWKVGVDGIAEPFFHPES